MAALALSSRQVRRLRALAHHLKPLVQLGQDGLSPGIVQAVERALLDHELIKVQMRQPQDKEAVGRAVADATGAALCGLVGHTVILYRPHPDKPRIELDPSKATKVPS
ncbi:MAG: ribosome assembly RNA-binding protein YhbY [Deltaproteobacteria bacterium]|nr:ribosome assembly RNA-binding protein YhbY [Deltaproteobacteria bacterium]MBI3390268.1 ribosome assembly RNA-binding protein YhbY [Deltaproteobacteria bacterium]